MKSQIARITCIAAALSVLLVALQADARFSTGLATPMPAARLIRNLSIYLKAHPDGADARYSLGRVYYAAFASNTNEVPIGSDTDDNSKNAQDIEITLPHKSGGTAETKRINLAPSVDQKIQYLGLALDNLTLAIKQRPDDARSHLTLGCTYEDGLVLLNKSEVAKIAIASKSTFGAQTIASQADLTKLASVWRAWAAREYLRAFDLASKHKPEGGIGPSVAEEAGADYLSVGDTDASVVNHQTVLQVRATVARLKRIPHAITPIIFSIHSGAMLSRATQTTKTVSFDLDGTGRPQRYSWLRPDIGILVWDPQHTGRITSGRQLFGSVTWWVFWRDGYRALDALDDNRDGRLSGAELNGIGVWFDRNGDGVCEPGEVVSARTLGIASIACRPTGKEGGMLASRAGIVMRDGTTYPSWDWVTVPISSAKGR